MIQLPAADEFIVIYGVFRVFVGIVIAFQGQISIVVNTEYCTAYWEWGFMQHVTILTYVPPHEHD